MPFPVAIPIVSGLVATIMRWFAGPFLGALIYVLKTRAGLIVMSLFVWAGINFAAINLVVEPIFDALRGYTQGSFGGGTYGNWMSQVAGYIWLDKVVTMYISAYATRYSITSTRLFLFKRGVGA